MRILTSTRSVDKSFNVKLFTLASFWRLFFKWDSLIWENQHRDGYSNVLDINTMHNMLFVQSVCFPSNWTSWVISQNLCFDITFNIYLSRLVRLEGKHGFRGNREVQTLNRQYPAWHSPVSTSRVRVADLGLFWPQGFHTVEEHIVQLRWHNRQSVTLGSLCKPLPGFNAALTRWTWEGLTNKEYAK